MAIGAILGTSLYQNTDCTNMSMDMQIRSVDFISENSSFINELGAQGTFTNVKNYSSTSLALKPEYLIGFDIACFLFILAINIVIMDY